MTSHNKLRLISLILCVFTLVGLCGCSGGCFGTDNTLERISRSGMLRIGVSANAKPLSFQGEDGELCGFSVDIGRQLSKRLGAQPQFIAVEPDECVAALDSDKIDIYIDLPTPSMETRTQIIRFNSVIASRQVVAVKSTSPITRLFDLKGKNVGEVSGSDAAKALSEAPALKQSLASVVSFSDVNALAAALDAGTVDAVVVDEAQFQNCVLGRADGYHILSDALSSGDCVIAFRHSDTAFHAKAQTHYSIMLSDGTIAEIKAKWLAGVAGV